MQHNMRLPQFTDLIKKKSVKTTLHGLKYRSCGMSVGDKQLSVLLVALYLGIL